MQLISVRKLLPRSIREALRPSWNALLRWEQHLRERTFYREFISRNDLVFDIGSNFGGKTRAFLSLDARVVAVEPNIRCVEFMRAQFGTEIAAGRLHVQCAAVGSAEGEITLTLVDSESGIYSGAAEFVHYGRSVGYSESHTVTVRCVTLDSLIQRYGMPKLIKIDVEGMDAEVLLGLTSKPCMLTFEYNTAAPLMENTRRCFHECERLGFTEANLTEWMNPQLSLTEWNSLNAVADRVEEWAKKNAARWGDVIVR